MQYQPYLLWMFESTWSRDQDSRSSHATYSYIVISGTLWYSALCDLPLSSQEGDFTGDLSIHIIEARIVHASRAHKCLSELLFFIYFA
jgi:hypothetical protein